MPSSPITSRACAARFALLAGVLRASVACGSAPPAAPQPPPLVIAKLPAPPGDAGPKGAAPSASPPGTSATCIAPDVRERLLACPSSSGAAHPSRAEVLEATRIDEVTRYGRSTSSSPQTKASASASATAAERAEERRRGLEPKPFAPGTEKLAQLHHAYRCDHPSDAELTHAEARLWWEARHWAEAAVLFERAAFLAPTSDVAPYSGMLYLEAINVLGSHFARTECFDDMAVNVPKLRAQLCAPALAASREETCTTLAKIEADIQRLKMQSVQP